MELEKAIELLKKTAKYSAVPGQKHLDLTLVNVGDLPEHQEALKVCQLAVYTGKIKKEELLERLGIS